MRCWTIRVQTSFHTRNMSNKGKLTKMAPPMRAARDERSERAVDHVRDPVQAQDEDTEHCSDGKPEHESVQN